MKETTKQKLRLYWQRFLDRVVYDKSGIFQPEEFLRDFDERIIDRIIGGCKLTVHFRKEQSPILEKRIVDSLVEVMEASEKQEAEKVS